MRDKIAKAIKKKREKLGMTGRDFAILLDIDATEVSRIESGKRNFSLDRLEKICEVLQLKIKIK